GVQGEVRVLVGDRDRVCVGRAPGRGRDEAAGCDDPVEGPGVYDEVLDDREGRRAPRLDRDDVAVLEAPHVELTRGRAVARAVRAAVDDHAAGPADPLPAVLVEGDRVLALADQGLV